MTQYRKFRTYIAKDMVGVEPTYSYAFFSYAYRKQHIFCKLYLLNLLYVRQKNTVVKLYAFVLAYLTTSYKDSRNRTYIFDWALST